eukprot:10169127-Alexandrium_andersonii.AAC.1
MAHRAAAMTARNLHARQWKLMLGIGALPRLGKVDCATGGPHGTTTTRGHSSTFGRFPQLAAS